MCSTITPPYSVDRRCRVLIADDDEDGAVSLSILLDSMGHETRAVYDGMAAVEQAEAFRPDVVIVDIDMPKLNGYQVARILKARPWPKAILLIAMTGWAHEADREHGRRAGFHAHLLKPVTIDALQAALTDANVSVPLDPDGHSR
jgi:CheY-like chemotaxis protein